MDTRTGEIFRDKQAALDALNIRGVKPKEAEKRLVQGTRPTLRKLRKMIRKQYRKRRK